MGSTLQAVSEKLSAKKLQFLAFFEFMLAFLDHREELGEAVAERHFSGDTRLSRAAQTSTVIAVVVIGVVAIIGILIYAQVQSALPAPQNSDLNNSSNSVTEGFGGAMELVPVVLIVLVASVVIGVVQRLR